MANEFQNLNTLILGTGLSNFIGSKDVQTGNLAAGVMGQLLGQPVNMTTGTLGLASHFLQRGAEFGAVQAQPQRQEEPRPTRQQDSLSQFDQPANVTGTPVREIINAARAGRKPSRIVLEPETGAMRDEARRRNAARIELARQLGIGVSSKP